MMLVVDLFTMIYEFIFNDIDIKIFRTVLDSLEVIFRGYGVFFVGRFISDLCSLFEAPMVQYDDGIPIPPSPIMLPKRNNKFYA